MIKIKQLINAGILFLMLVSANAYAQLTAPISTSWPPQHGNPLVYEYAGWSPGQTSFHTPTKNVWLDDSFGSASSPHTSSQANPYKVPDAQTLRNVFSTLLSYYGYGTDGVVINFAQGTYLMTWVHVFRPNWHFVGPTTGEAIIKRVIDPSGEPSATSYVLMGGGGPSHNTFGAVRYFEGNRANDFINIRIANLTLDCNYATMKTHSKVTKCSAISLYAAHCVIENVKVKNFGSEGGVDRYWHSGQQRWIVTQDRWSSYPIWLRSWETSKYADTTGVTHRPYLYTNFRVEGCTLYGPFQSDLSPGDQFYSTGTGIKVSNYIPEFGTNKQQNVYGGSISTDRFNVLHDYNHVHIEDNTINNVTNGKPFGGSWAHNVKFEDNYVINAGAVSNWDTGFIYGKLGQVDGNGNPLAYPCKNIHFHNNDFINVEAGIRFENTINTWVDYNTFSFVPHSSTYSSTWWWWDAGVNVRQNTKEIKISNNYFTYSASSGSFSAPIIGRQNLASDIASSWWGGIKDLTIVGNATYANWAVDDVILDNNSQYDEDINHNPIQGGQSGNGTTLNLEYQFNSNPPTSVTPSNITILNF